MRLIISGELPLERQEIEISDTAHIELRLSEYEAMYLHPRPTQPGWYCIEVMATAVKVLLQPASSNVMHYLLQRFPERTKEN